MVEEHTIHEAAKFVQALFSGNTVNEGRKKEALCPEMLSDATLHVTEEKEVFKKPFLLLGRGKKKNENKVNRKVGFFPKESEISTPRTSTP